MLVINSHPVSQKLIFSLHFKNEVFQRKKIEMLT